MEYNTDRIKLQEIQKNEGRSRTVVGLDGKKIVLINNLFPEEEVKTTQVSEGPFQVPQTFQVLRSSSGLFNPSSKADQLKQALDRKKTLGLI